MRYALVLMFALGMTNAAFGCSIASCQEGSPRTPFDLPSCSEYEMNSTFVAALEDGDRGAVVILRQRYRDSFTFSERNRIGGALIKAKEDSEVWNELLARAEDAVRFAPSEDDQPNAELAKWCAERGWEANAYRDSLVQSLWTISEDRRALPLMRRALASRNESIVMFAIYGLATAKEISALPAIEEALRKQKSPEELAYVIAPFNSDAADAIARKYLKDDERWSIYLTSRGADD
jgi:hypothetical protein